MLKLLLQGGSNADQKDEDGRTPFSYAVCCGHKRVVKAFLKRRNVNINSKDNSGRSPLSWALRDLHSQAVFAVRWLLKRKDLVVTEEDRDLMKKRSKQLGVHFSGTKEEESENESGKNEARKKVRERARKEMAEQSE